MDLTLQLEQARKYAVDFSFILGYGNGKNGMNTCRNGIEIEYLPTSGLPDALLFTCMKLIECQCHTNELRRRAGVLD